MPIEDFFDVNRPGPQFKTMIERQKVEGSPLGILARHYRTEGRSGLITVSARIRSRLGSVLIPDPVAAGRWLKKEELRTYSINRLAIMFGSAIPTIEHIAQTNKCDLGLFWSHYDMAVSGTAFTMTHPNQPGQISTLSFNRWVEIYRMVEESPTLTVFLEEDGLGLLSPQLSGLLRLAYFQARSYLAEFTSFHQALANSLFDLG